MGDAAKVLVRSEQIYGVAFHEGLFWVGDRSFAEIPWKSLSNTFLYAIDEVHLEALLSDAASRGFMILDGALSDRRGLRGFSVAIGAWGYGGVVECRTADAWAIDADASRHPPEEALRIQRVLRDLCIELNQEPTTFRPTALRFLSGLYRRLGLPREFDGAPAPVLPPSVALLARRAHVGGPIVHARTTLAPFVSLDRDRAYGEAMLLELPSGDPTEVDLGTRPLLRWSPSSLMGSMGIAEATVKLEMGPFLPLLPITRYHHVPGKTRTLYPTGTLRGFWVLAELAALEQTGRGRVEQLHRVVLFGKARPLAPVVRYLRSIEPIVKGIKMKRLEHMLYGQCAKTLHLTRFSTTRGDVRPLPADLLDARTLDRLTSRVEVQRFHRRGVKSPPREVPLHMVSGKLSESATFGSMDRPDRSAFITAQNRIAMMSIVDQLDVALKPARSGAYVGRVYVDGIDIEASPSEVPPLHGVSVRAVGSTMSIYRANAYVQQRADGTKVLESGGHPVTDPEDLVRVLDQMAEDREDAGPFAGGRVWPFVQHVEDPRLLENQRSEPMHLDLGLVDRLGFSSSIVP